MYTRWDHCKLWVECDIVTLKYIMRPSCGYYANFEVFNPIQLVCGDILQVIIRKGKAAASAANTLPWGKWLKNFLYKFVI